MSKNTPGPWALGNIENGFIEIDAIGPEHHGALANVVWKMEDDERTPRCEANARLIAAAPELLEIALWVDKWLGDCAISGSVKASIAKATGAE